MTDLTPLTIFVNSNVAENAAKKGMLEVALRRKDAKFKAMVKCAVENNLTSSNSDTNLILNKALEVVSKNTASLEEVNHTVRNLSKNIEKVDGHLVSVAANVKNMSTNVDMIFKSTQAIKAMSALNAALSIANIAVDVVGFTIISNHLTVMDKELHDISQKLDDLKNVEKGKLIQEFHGLTMKINAISDSMALGDGATIKDMENLLIAINSFIEKLLYGVNNKSLEISELLNMIYSLIVPYTSVLSIFITKFFIKYQKFPNNFESFTNLFNLLLDDDYLETVEEYWFLDKDESNEDTICIMDAMKLLTLNCYTELSDRVEIIKQFKTEERIHAFDDKVADAAKHEATEVASEVAKLLQKNDEECDQVLRAALSK